MTKYKINCKSDAQEIKRYMKHLKHHIRLDLRKYGFGWNALVEAYELPSSQQRELADKWREFYYHGGEQPNLPNPVEHQEYLQYIHAIERLEELESEADDE